MRRGISVETEDRRKSYRKFVVKTIEYSLVPSPKKETFDGVIATMNESGICLLTSKHLTNGQEIEIKDNDYLTDKTATVRWSEQYNGYFYKVGLRFGGR
jgi:hypothetical protein